MGADKRIRKTDPSQDSLTWRSGLLPLTRMTLEALHDCESILVYTRLKPPCQNHLNVPGCEKENSDLFSHYRMCTELGGELRTLQNASKRSVDYMGHVYYD